MWVFSKRWVLISASVREMDCQGLTLLCFLPVYFKSHHLPQAVVTISHTNTSSKTFVHSQTGLCSPLHIINVNSKTLWPAVVQISTCGAITHTKHDLYHTVLPSLTRTHTCCSADLKHMCLFIPIPFTRIITTLTHIWPSYTYSPVAHSAVTQSLWAYMRSLDHGVSSRVRLVASRSR